MKARNIGVKVSLPTQSCEDPKCPFHGSLRVRGQLIQGEVASTEMQKVIVVKRELTHKIPKYERWEKRTNRYTSYCPPCIKVKVGDKVKIMECRPLSKTCSWVVIEKERGKK